MRKLNDMIEQAQRKGHQVRKIEGTSQLVIDARIFPRPVAIGRLRKLLSASPVNS